MVKNVPADAEVGRDAGLIPGSGRSPGGGHDNPLQCSCLESPWTEEPGGLQSVEWQRVRHDRATSQHSTGECSCKNEGNTRSLKEVKLVAPWHVGSYWTRD